MKRLHEEKTELQEKLEGVNDRCQQVEAEFLQQNRDMLSLDTMISSLQENLLREKDRSLRIKKIGSLTAKLTSVVKKRNV